MRHPRNLPRGREKRKQELRGIVANRASISEDLLPPLPAASTILSELVEEPVRERETVDFHWRKKWKTEAGESAESQANNRDFLSRRDLIIPPRLAFVNSTIIINDDVREGRGRGQRRLLILPSLSRFVRFLSLPLWCLLSPFPSTCTGRECKLITPRAFREKHIKRPTLLRHDITA